MTTTNYTKNFTNKELRCRCGCGSREMPQRGTQERLQLVRTRFGRPVYLTSAKRCKRHPVESKKGTPGTHYEGFALDLKAQGAHALELMVIAIEEGFHGVGVSQKGSGRFIHLDDAPDAPGRPRPWIWSY